MPEAVALRDHFTATELRRLAAESRHASQSRQLLSLAVLAGMSREEAARIRTHGAAPNPVSNVGDAGRTTTRPGFWKRRWFQDRRCRR